MGMKLHVIFGWHLDGPHYPEKSAVGHHVVGPTGLLQQLALRYGLLRNWPHQAVRIGNYLSRLRELDDEQQFYSRSFRLDPWGTARAIIHLRDELVACGWRPQLASSFDDNETVNASNRLETLARLELLAASGIEC